MAEESKTQSTKKRKLDKTKELEIVGEVKPKKVNRKLPARRMPELTFDAWWIQAQKKTGFKNYMKEVVFKHFRARGFLKSKKFDDGLKDFGIKS